MTDPHPPRAPHPTDRTAPVSAWNACAALVALATREAGPDVDPRRFIRRLGHAGAGVRPGPLGILDLARAGENRLPGHGFRPVLDDGTPGQARHFCGIAACCERFGAKPTWWVSVYLRRDPPDSPDGRLTDLAIEFVTLLLRGELATEEAAGWLGASLCANEAPDAPATRPPHVRGAPPA